MRTTLIILAIAGAMLSGAAQAELNCDRGKLLKNKVVTCLNNGCTLVSIHGLGQASTAYTALHGLDGDGRYNICVYIYQKGWVLENAERID